MKYETPELTTLMPAINAVQSVSKGEPYNPDNNTVQNETIAAYADWE